MPLFLARLVVLMGVVALLGSCAGPRPKPVPAPAPAPVPPPKPKPVAELRGVWVSDTTRLDWDKATADLQRAGFNTMYVNLASSGATFYPASKVLPSLVKDSTDPVARGIKLAHQRGLAVHAKLLVMFMFKATPRLQNSMLAANRVMRGPDGKPILQTGYTWLCPSQPANRTLVAATLNEILARYPVDGVQLDYIRFCEQPSCYCDHCRREFERGGLYVAHWPEDVMTGALALRYNEWRKRLITDWVRELNAQARGARPTIRLSAAVFPDLDRAREEKAQDWKRWLESGLLDYVCTMTYRPDPHEFETLVRKQLAWSPQRKQVVVGIGSWKLERKSQLTGQINTVRQLGAPGFVLFSYDDCAARDFLPDLARQ